MKLNPLFIGLLQAIGVIAYCVLIALIIGFLDSNVNESMGIFGIATMLIVLVFSAAITGSIVFGYPAYLFLKRQKVKEPLFILAFTVIFCLTILVLAALVYLLV